MREIELSQELFVLLEKYVPDGVKAIDSIKKEDNQVKLELSKENLSELQDEISCSIVDVGMDNQDTVNEIGTALYELYDEILYQKENKE